MIGVMANWTTQGWNELKELFDNLIKNGRLAHAYLFTGQEMIGKKTFALELSSKILSFRSSTSQSGVELPSNPDILLINPLGSDSGQSIAIAESRNIKNFLSLSSYFGGHKIVIVDDAHLMTVEAQNALLKALEEPTPSSFLILITANPSALLPTIISRCQEIKFSSHPKTLIDEISAGSKLTGSQKKFISEFANGRAGLVRRILEEDSYGDVEKSIKGLINLIKADINERMIEAQKLSDDKNKEMLASNVLYWQLYARLKLGEPKAGKILRGLLDLHQIISQPQFNRRLALEAFLVNL